MRRDLELDVVVGVDLASREMLDGCRMDENVVLPIIRTTDRPEEAELAREPRAVAP